MQIPILIEPIEGGRYCARAGEPFAVRAEGNSAAEAAQLVEQLLVDRIRNGARYAVVNVPNGVPSATHLPFPADDLYKTDPGFHELKATLCALETLN